MLVSEPEQYNEQVAFKKKKKLMKELNKLSRLMKKRYEQNGVHIIYVLIFPNAKLYFGQAKVSAAKRWQNGSGYSRQPLIWNAICKYRWENINKKILIEGLNQEEANNLEIELIASFKSNLDEFGYNKAIGGAVNSGFKLSDEAREKLSKIRKGTKSSEETKKKIGLASKRLWANEERRKKGVLASKKVWESEEHQEKMSNLLKEHWKNDEYKQNQIKKSKQSWENEEYRRVQMEHFKSRWADQNYKERQKELRREQWANDEFKQKMSKIHKDRTINCNKIAQFSLKGEFIAQYGNSREAHEATGVDRSKITMAVNRKRNTAGGFIWINIDENGKLVDTIENRIKTIKKNKNEALKKWRKVNSKPVAQYSLEGKQLNNYASAKEASKKTGIAHTSISSCATNKLIQSGGFLWIYLNKDGEPNDDVAERVEKAKNKGHLFRRKKSKNLLGT